MTKHTRQYCLQVLCYRELQFSPYEFIMEHDSEKEIQETTRQRSACSHCERNGPAPVC